MIDDSIPFENKPWVLRLQCVLSVINSDQPRTGIADIDSFYKEILENQDIHSQMGMLEDFFLLGSQYIDSRKLGILQKYFRPTIEWLHSRDGYYESLLCSRLLEISEFAESIGEQERNRILGIAKERLAEHCQDYQKPFLLEESKSHFLKAHCHNDCLRIEQKKMASIEEHPIWMQMPEQIPTSIVEKTQADAKRKIDYWLSLSDEDRYNHLCNDFFEICPSDFQEEPLEIWDLLRTVGCENAMRFTADKRGSNLQNVDPQKERWWMVHMQVSRISWGIYWPEVFAWLSHDRRSQICVQSLVAHSNLSRTSYTFLVQGMNHFLKQDWLSCCSLWIPTFERLLRERIQNLGGGTINPMQRANGEEFLLLGNLLEKSKDYFPSVVVAFWCHWYESVDGVGENIRNDHAHGIMQPCQCNAYAAILTFHSFLFLILADIQSKGQI